MIATLPQRIERRNTDGWSYETAFARHRGLLDGAEQERLRGSRVAIAGMGGVGGIHLATLARLGIGSFHLADPDMFDVANFNRQHGATVGTLGRNKALVMAEEAVAINPEVDVKAFPEAIGPDNVAAFLDGVDVLVDGIDFFNVAARRLVYREARRRGIWAITAGPMGFGTAWLVFSPAGMSFDDYFDLHDGQERIDQLIAFAVGLSPRAVHLRYLDLKAVDPASGAAPSVGFACQLCAGVTGAEVVKILLGNGAINPAPWYHQFDARLNVFRQGRLRGGNRHPWQRLKRWWLKRHLRRLGRTL
jgi:molybdopterin/thiamine biosynthesis adenylyltransferase